MLRFLFSSIILFIGLSIGALAQPNRTDLEKQRQNLLQSIQETKEQLAAISKDKKASLSQLRALQAKLNARQKLINNINQDINSINHNIRSSAQEINQLQSNLEQQQIRYAQSVRYSYRFRNSYDMLAFLFSADDFNEAVRRMKYLKRYRDYRSKQLEQIKYTQSKIQNKISSLNNQKDEKNVLLEEQQGQSSEIAKETSEKDAVVNELKGREKELNAQIARSQKAARSIDQQINKLIQREIELARKRAEEERRRKEEEERKRLAAQKAAAEQAKNTAANTGGASYGNVSLNTGSGAKAEPTKPTEAGKPAEAASRPSAPPADEPLAPRAVNKTAMAANSYRMSLTPEVAALSDNFEANRGKLPWPVEKGYISLGYGTYSHPIQTHVTLENYGVTITTPPSSAVRAVFDGKVTSVLFIPGSGWTVLINHGIYYTVYSGLAETSIQKDQQVRIKQGIGKVGLNEEGIPVLNFQVWKGGSKVDPEGWIAR